MFGITTPRATGGTINQVLSKLPGGDGISNKPRPEAQLLFDRLKRYTELDEPILFGHQDSTAYGVNWVHPALADRGSSGNAAGFVKKEPRFRRTRFKRGSEPYYARPKIRFFSNIGVASGTDADNLEGGGGATFDVVSNGEQEGDGDGTSFGQDDGSEDGSENSVDSDVHSVTGNLPAVYGWDLGGIDIGESEDKTNIDGIPFSLIRQLIIEADARGGINTLSFHQNHPINKKNIFVSAQNNHDINVAIPDKVVEMFTEKFFSRLGQVAEFLRNLKRENGELIPVILRLFHEHTEMWPWWGRATVSEENYKRLFRTTVNRLVVEEGLTNVLFAYSPQDVHSEEEYLYGYPGDEFVDILGLDQYAVLDQVQMDQLSKNLELITRMADEREKIAALTETGVDEVRIENWWSEYLLPALARSKQTQKIAWVLTWRNASKTHFFVPYDGHPEAEDFRKFAESGLIQFEKQVEGESSQH